MTDVTIDGQKYVPAELLENRDSIGVAISTYNRKEVLTDVVQKWRDMLPPGAVLIVVDDASTVTPPEATYAFKTNQGIAAVKNKSLELLEAAGVRHMFLTDDDFYPISEDWWKPYVQSAEPHLMYLFKDTTGKTRLNDNTVIYQDDTVIAYRNPRGPLLYIDAHKVLPVVGGMNRVFGRWGYEHVNWSDRIYHNGLTSFRYMDVPDSNQLFYCKDEHNEIVRTVSAAERNELYLKNKIIYDELLANEDKSFQEYKEQKDTVLFCLYGRKQDIQRPGTSFHLEQTYALTDSIINKAPDAELICFTDLEAKPYKTVAYRKSEAVWSVFFQRWAAYYRYLRENENIQNVWCVDSTDVLMLNNPFEEMKPGTLYVGYEPELLASDWMRKHHPNSKFQQLLNDKPNLQLLNAGIVGGDRETVMEFCHDIMEYHQTYLEQVFDGKEPAGEVLDMGGFNYCVRQPKWEHRLVWGSQVTTVFKREETKAKAYWKHK